MFGDKLEENHQTKERDEKVDKFEDRIEKKRVLLTEFDDESNIKKFNKELFNKKLNSVKGKKHKNERKKNCKKNDIYLSNTKSINSNQNLRDYTNIEPMIGYIISLQFTFIFISFSLQMLEEKEQKL